MAIEFFSMGFMLPSGVVVTKACRGLIPIPQIAFFTDRHLTKEVEFESLSDEDKQFLETGNLDEGRQRLRKGLNEPKEMENV